MTNLNFEKLKNKDGISVKEILEKERMNELYDPNDVGTYTQEPLYNDLFKDLISHLYFNNFNIADFRINVREDNSFFPMSRHSNSDTILANKIVKFKKPSGGVRIGVRKLPTLFPARIVKRYAMYKNKNFNEESLTHYMSVPVFYHSKKEFFSVQLPEYFKKDIGEKLINIPVFEYSTEKELLSKYEIDIKYFAKEYYRFFLNYQESKKVILIESNSKKEATLESLFSNDFSSIIKTNPKNLDSIMVFGSSLNISKGLLYGDVFFQTNDESKINFNNPINLSSYRKESESYKLERAKIYACIEYTDEQWENLNKIILKFKEAQKMFEDLLKDSLNYQEELDKPLKKFDFNNS